MAFKCGFFNSINGDRLYNAEDMNIPYSKIVSNGVFGDAESSTDFQVAVLWGGVSQTKKIVVKKGQGIFDGKWAILDADMPMNVPSPHVSYNRIDSVIVRIDNSDDVRAGTIVYKQGEAALDPVPIELENNNYIKEYRLAKILIPASAATLSDSNITDCRPTSECGFIHNLLWDSDITATYAQWEAQFTEWFNEKKTMLDEANTSYQETFENTQENNQNAFDEWFNNVKETLSTQTLIQSFTSRYVTTGEREYTIPIQIPEFKSYIDILQVYINGLICIKDVDYTINDFESIELINGVDSGTEVSFIVYKSMDGTGIDKFIEDVDDLIARQDNVESDFTALETRVDALEVNNANTALWDGANTLGSGEEVKPSKALSACKNGWLLAWSAYNPESGVATDSRFSFTYVPKKLMNAVSNGSFDVCSGLIHALGNDGTIETAAKRVYISDTQITGYAGNTAGTYNGKLALRFIYEY